MMTDKLNLHDISGNKAKVPCIIAGTLRATNAARRHKFGLWRPGYGIDNAIDFAIDFAINLKFVYCYYNCYSTIFGYDISHCLRLLTWICHCLFLLFMHLTMTLLWLCVDYSINH